MSKQIKVGILTSIGFPNPGTVFQAYGLHQFLDKIPELDVELINYRMNAPKYNNIGYATGHGLISVFVRTVFGIRTYLSTSFLRNNFVLYPKDHYIEGNDEKALSEINDRYDIIVLGSDQIWNTEFNKFDKSFFLNFVKGKKKGAYAPSIGMPDWPESQKEEIKKLLADFSFIGVREKQTVDIVQKLCNVPVHWSLDPTFLLNKEEWSKIAKKPKIKGDYIFEYCISKNDGIVKATETLAKKTGLPVIEYGGLRKRVPSAKRMPHPDSDVWLGYMMNAKYIITDSFHGCAFSINTNKNFYAIISAGGNRITSILSLFGLQERLINGDENFNELKPIDWNVVNPKLEAARSECGEWLKKSIFE